MRTLLRFVVCLGYFGFFSLLGCGAEPAAVAVIGAAITGSAVASTAQVDDSMTNGESSGSLDSFEGIYHLSAISVDNNLVTCPSSFTGWFEANGLAREITRGFFLFMDCTTQGLDRIEIDGDFLIEDIDDDVCSQSDCLRLELNVSGSLGQAQRVWRGFLLPGGDGFVFAQVDSFNGSALAGSAWRTAGGPTNTPNPTEDMMDTPMDPATDTSLFRAPG